MPFQSDGYASHCIAEIDKIRVEEYPQLEDTTYLDHAGTTLYAKSLIQDFSADMMSNLFGNPHSASAASQLSMRRIEDVRLRVLGFFGADPEQFDVVFVANATAGIKVVLEAFRDYGQDTCHQKGKGFWYGYHKDSHTSLIGVREAALPGHRCFSSDGEVNNWLSNHDDCAEGDVGLFAYPAQSNFNGRRLPLDWTTRIRQSSHSRERKLYSLLDAASLVSTSRLDLSDAASAPDFTVISFYKIFGFPDLGALIIRRDSGHVLQRRKYFGGGTVDMVSCLEEQWHAKKADSLHDQLEDGTLPFHSVIALDSAFNVHERLFGTLDRVSRHTTYLARSLYDGLSSLRHFNGKKVCKIYKDRSSTYGDSNSQGPIIAFNIRNSKGDWVGKSEVEKLAAVRNIQLRTGSVCNPGGTASALRLTSEEMFQNFGAGQRCGDENDSMNGKPTGIIRVSLGAMSNLRDVQHFLQFVTEFYVDAEMLSAPPLEFIDTFLSPQFYIESLMIYPIKSCGGWKIRPGIDWEVREEGLVWDREWCLVHLNGGPTMSQKRYPRMALLLPTIDLEGGVLKVRRKDFLASLKPQLRQISIPLSANPKHFSESNSFHDLRSQSSRLCGDIITTTAYHSQEISDFFTDAVGVPCTLARFPAGGSGPTTRHSKAHLQQHQLRPANWDRRGTLSTSLQKHEIAKGPILLSNESPILTISRSSLNRLNEEIKLTGGKAAQAEVFRANIVIAEDLQSRPGGEQPYIEDSWQYLQIGEQYFQMLGSCRRCHMICVDQDTAEKNEEPFITLAKTRRFNGKVFFGQHTCHLPVSSGVPYTAQIPTIKVGDPVKASSIDPSI